MLIDQITGRTFSGLFTVRPGFDFASPLDYFQLVSHAAGHGGWAHLMGNMSFILLLGPILEEKYGGKKLAYMILITAFVTGVINSMFFDTGLLGASGIVFMFIILSSVVSRKEGTIPLTFILIVLLYLGQEVMRIFNDDSISQFAHIIGGLCGGAFGFYSPKSGEEDQETEVQKEIES